MKIRAFLSSFDLPDIVLVFLAFTMPLFPRVIPVLILFAVVTIIVNDRAFLKKAFMSNFNPASGHLFLILLYLFYLIGMFYSRNMEYGWFDMGIKLPLLILPLFVSVYLFRKRKIDKILWAFVIASLIVVLYNLILSAVEYNEDRSVFYYYKVSRILHTSYQALYICFALAFLLYIYSGLMQKRIKIFCILLSILFSVYIILLSSKAGLIGLLMVWLIFWGIKIIKTRRYVFYIGAIILTLIMFYLSMKVFTYSIGRVEYAVSTMQKVKQGELITDGTSERVMIWKVALKLIVDYPIGVGTGDVKDKLLEQYLAKGMNDCYEKKLNAHNQYFQTGIALGFPGLLLLLSIFITPLKKLFQEWNYLGLIFLALCGMNFLFESILEVQAGVIFFSFFYPLIIIKNREKINE